MTYTGINETYVGQKPGLTVQKTMLEPGVYQTRTAKVFPQYTGWDDTKAEEMTEPTLKIAVTCPEKWITNPTPVRLLKETFLKHYRKKFPDAKLSKLPDEAIDVAVKDESLFLFSKKVQDEDAAIHKTFYDRQDVYMMLPEDWEKQRCEEPPCRGVNIHRAVLASRRCSSAARTTDPSPPGPTRAAPS